MAGLLAENSDYLIPMSNVTTPGNFEKAVKKRRAKGVKKRNKDEAQTGRGKSKSGVKVGGGVKKKQSGGGGKKNGGKKKQSGGGSKKKSGDGTPKKKSKTTKKCIQKCKTFKW